MARSSLRERPRDELDRSIAHDGWGMCFRVVLLRMTVRRPAAQARPRIRRWWTLSVIALPLLNATEPHVKALLDAVITGASGPFWR
jgi:hypothetical protein